MTTEEHENLINELEINIRLGKAIEAYVGWYGSFDDCVDLKELFPVISYNLLALSNKVHKLTTTD